MNEQDNKWSRKLAEEHIADLLDAAKNGKTQTIVDFDGNFEVRFIAPHLETAVSELSLPAESGESDLETLDALQMPAPPVVRPDEKKVDKSHKRAICREVSIIRHLPHLDRRRGSDPMKALESHPLALAVTFSSWFPICSTW